MGQVAPFLLVSGHAVRLSEAVASITAEAVAIGHIIHSRVAWERIVAAHLGVSHDELYIGLTEANCSKAVAFISRLMAYLRSGHYTRDAVHRASERVAQERPTADAPRLRALLDELERDGRRTDPFRDELDYLQTVAMNALLFLDHVKREADAVFRACDEQVLMERTGTEG